MRHHFPASPILSNHEKRECRKRCAGALTNAKLQIQELKFSIQNQAKKMGVGGEGRSLPKLPDLGERIKAFDAWCNVFRIDQKMKDKVFFNVDIAS